MAKPEESPSVIKKNLIKLYTSSFFVSINGKLMDE